MAEDFVGYKVSVLLHSGVKLEGVISHIEPSTQQMTLKEVNLLFTGQPPHYTPIYGVVGNDIKDLQVLAAPSAKQQQFIKTMDNHVLDKSPSPKYQQTNIVEKTLTPAKSNLKSHQKSKQQLRSNKKNNIDCWAKEDVKMFKEEEFDFQKNLDMFDKAKEFAKIREYDETAPEELLVTINRLPPKNNLLPSENVLGLERTVYHNLDDTDDVGDESDNDSQTPNEYKKARSSSQHQYATKIVTTNDRIICPTVSPLQMAHAEHECTNISSSFEELLIENGGRGTSLFVLQVLSKMDVVSPSVVILIGNNKNGALGLVAARHLINHGCLVTVCITTKNDLCDSVIYYEAMAKKFGISVCHHTKDLGESDLVIDAILGPDDKLIDIQDSLAYKAVCNAIDWANRQTKPVLSIDFPSGIDASTGIPHHEDHMIHPKWTICLGAPKTGCKSTHITGELYLVDIGIPSLCWKRVGIKGNTIPWGADFLVALEYDILK